MDAAAADLTDALCEFDAVLADFASPFHQRHFHYEEHLERMKRRSSASVSDSSGFSDSESKCGRHPACCCLGLASVCLAGRPVQEACRAGTRRTRWAAWLPSCVASLERCSSQVGLTGPEPDLAGLPLGARPPLLSPLSHNF